MIGGAGARVNEPPPQHVRILILTPQSSSAPWANASLGEAKAVSGASLGEAEAVSGANLGEAEAVSGAKVAPSPGQGKPCKVAIVTDRDVQALTTFGRGAR